MVRSAEVDGEVRDQELTTTTDSSGTATFSIPKRGDLALAVLSWGDGTTSNGDAPLAEAVHQSIENHPDEILLQRFSRSGSNP